MREKEGAGGGGGSCYRAGGREDGALRGLEGETRRSEKRSTRGPRAHAARGARPSARAPPPLPSLHPRRAARTAAAKARRTSRRLTACAPAPHGARNGRYAPQVARSYRARVRRAEPAACPGSLILLLFLLLPSCEDRGFGAVEGIEWTCRVFSALVDPVEEESHCPLRIESASSDQKAFLVSPSRASEPRTDLTSAARALKVSRSTLVLTFGTSSCSCVSLVNFIWAGSVSCGPSS